MDGVRPWAGGCEEQGRGSGSPRVALQWLNGFLMNGFLLGLQSILIASTQDDLVGPITVFREAL